MTTWVNVCPWSAEGIEILAMRPVVGVRGHGERTEGLTGSGRSPEDMDSSELIGDYIPHARRCVKIGAWENTGKGLRTISLPMPCGLLASLLVLLCGR